MSTNKTTVASTRQVIPRPKNRPSIRQHQELVATLDSAMDALDASASEKINLQHQLESLAKSLGQERLFWYYMVYNFRFHHAMAAVAITPEEKSNAADNLQTATLDLLMSPSDPTSSFTRSFHQDHRLHRVLAGQPNDMLADKRPNTGRPVNASKIA